MTNEELAVQIKAGQRALLPALWGQVERLIGQKAFRFYSAFRSRCDASGVTEEDLLQEGFFAVMDAVSAYDPDAGVRFSSYLNYPLKNRYHKMIGLRGGKDEPIYNATRLDAPAGDDPNADSLLEMIPDPSSDDLFEEAINSVWREELRAAEEEVLKSLPDDLADVVRAHFFEGKTLQKIANERGKAIEGIRQKEKKAITRIRCSRRYRPLLPFIHDDIEAFGMRGTGLNIYRSIGSATERAAERLCGC